MPACGKKLPVRWSAGSHSVLSNGNAVEYSAAVADRFGRALRFGSPCRQYFADQRSTMRIGSRHDGQPHSSGAAEFFSAFAYHDFLHGRTNAHHPFR